MTTLAVYTRYQKITTSQDYSTVIYATQSNKDGHTQNISLNIDTRAWQINLFSIWRKWKGRGIQIGAYQILSHPTSDTRVSRLGLCKLVSIGFFRPPGTLVPKAFCFSRDAFLTRHRISELRRPIAAKLWTVISICVNFLKQVQKLGGSSPKNFYPR